MEVADNEAMINNQSQLIDELKTQLDDKQTAKPAVALVVRYSGGTRFVAEDPVIYDIVETNVGNSFNETSGSFHAPIAGVYVLSVSTCSLSGTWGSLDIFKDDAGNGEGSKTLIGKVGSGDAAYSDCNSVMAISYIEVGQKVWVEWRGGLYGSKPPGDYRGWNSFGAVLIH